MSAVRVDPSTWAPLDPEWVLEDWRELMYQKMEEEFGHSVQRCKPRNGGPLDTRVWNLHGISWLDAEVPPRWHKCTPQTYAVLGFECALRCACGALAFEGRGRRRWMERNQRMRGR